MKTCGTKQKERVKIWRLPELGNAELMHANYVRQTFPRHSHDGFAVGVIERGALGFRYRGENVVAPAGSINLANPDEAHTGHAAAESGWTYRMFYFDAGVLRKAASEIAGHPNDYPFFQAGVIHDSQLAEVIRSFHIDLENGRNSLVEAESRFLWMLAQLILRHSDAPPSLHSVRREPKAVRLAKAYIEENWNEEISIGRLASVANLSPFHFIRVFGKETGLPPHAYLTQVRVRRAKALIDAGWSIASAACEAGFVDQSHLSRHFKRILGVTPGQFGRMGSVERKKLGR